MTAQERLPRAVKDYWGVLVKGLAEQCFRKGAASNRGMRNSVVRLRDCKDSNVYTCDGECT